MKRAINRACVRSLPGRFYTPLVLTYPALPKNNDRKKAKAFLGFLGFLGGSGKGVENRPPFALSPYARKNGKNVWGWFA